VDISIDPVAVEGALLALGEPGFPRSLIDLLMPDVSIDHVSIVAFDSNIVPRLVGAASRSARNVAEEAGRLYERSSFYRHDPGTQQLQAGRAADAPILFRLRAQDIQDRDYRDQIYTRYQLLERVSLIQQVAGQWIIVNLYRGKGTGPFKRGEISRVSELSRLLVALAGKHVKLLTPRPSQPRPLEIMMNIESVLATFDAGLSERERAVCARALRGLTVEGIALDLGVKPSTVATLRRRAYAKLNISSLNELFALCIASLSLARINRHSI
jgi:DNA-binding CsgD family transcriptional regulator